MKIERCAQYIIFLNQIMSQKFKILVASSYANTLSARPEAEIFISLAQRGHHIDILTEGTSHYADVFRSEGINVIDHTPSSKFSRKTILLIRNLVKSKKHDFLILYNSKAIVNGLLAAIGLPIKVILYRGCAGNISWLDPTSYFKYLNPRVDKVICNAQSANDLLCKQPFFKNKKAITIHKGHDLKWYEDVPPFNWKNFNIPQNSFIVCCAANARPVKGIKFLLKAFQELEYHSNIHLVVLGRGHDTKEHQNIINNGPYKNQIHLPGFHSNSLSVVKSSDLFVLPSIAQETLTKSVIEAMALETAVIIADVAGNGPLVTDGESGIIVPTKNPKAIANSIINLYNDPDKKRRFATNGKTKIIKELSHTTTVDQYEQLFIKLKK